MCIITVKIGAKISKIVHSASHHPGLGIVTSSPALLLKEKGGVDMKIWPLLQSKGESLDFNSSLSFRRGQG